MAKLYSKNSTKQVNYLKPKKETVRFLLDYSKALKINSYKDIKFESFLN